MLRHNGGGHAHRDRSIHHEVGITGITDFTWGEIRKIKSLFPEYVIEYLFARDIESEAS